MREPCSAAVVWLFSEAAAVVIGHAMVVDGGVANRDAVEANATGVEITPGDSARLSTPNLKFQKVILPPKSFSCPRSG
jgi:hypothetical protein